MFTDIHTHILPAIDDGCLTMEEAIKLLKSEAENGVNKIILTPHFNAAHPQFNKKELLERIREISSAALSEGINIELYPGVEISPSPDIVKLLNESNYVLTLLNKGSYLLIEAPFTSLPYKFSEILFKIKLNSIVPILAHPERSEIFGPKSGYLKKLKDEGILIQINTSSLCCSKFSATYKRAETMLKMGIVDLIASDCHYMEGRFSNFEQAYKVLQKIVGEKESEVIALENPNNILLNKDIL